MDAFELKEASLAALMRIIEDQPGGYGYLFRGQACTNWGLIPSLYRIKSPHVIGSNFESNYHSAEAEYVDEFFREALLYLPDIKRNFSNDRILAQHFGVPTRLLDWTIDPLIATYFAVSNFEHPGDAAVFLILPEGYFLPEELGNLDSYSAIALRPPAIDKRVIAQKSVFTFHPFGPTDAPFVSLDKRDNVGNQITSTSGIKRGFVKITIPEKMKAGLYHSITKIGIDRKSLFPGPDGVGSYVATKFGARL